jgi:DNA repair exonuclease SbcCD ATPase subunit
LQEAASAEGAHAPESQPVEETPAASEEERQEAATEEPAAQAPAESEELSRVRAEYEKRLSGFQSMHDKKIAEFNGKIESLDKELAAAKDSVSAFEKKLEAKEQELASMRERLSVAEDAHRKLTGGALTVGDAPAAAKSMSEFLADHGGDFSAAVKADPETYKRICAANGWQPVALINK